MSEVTENGITVVANNYWTPNDRDGERFECAEGAWMYTEDGEAYLDMLAGYSANNFGHGNPIIREALIDQEMTGLTLAPRAFATKQLYRFGVEIGELTGYEMVLPMNGGAEAVETAIKTSRKWGQEVKGVPVNQGNIIVMNENFHGRTTTIVSFSDDEQARNGFGPFTPGFRKAEFGNVDDIEDVMDENTVAVLFEPIQGEAGVRVPPPGFLRKLRELCTREKVLMVADEIQSGFGRTGKNFACDHEDVKPDMMIVAKALGGGRTPTSAVLSSKDILGVLEPGDHGSTYGGNPLACAVARAAISILKSGQFQPNVTERGEQLRERLDELVGNGLTEVRGKGLWYGFDIDPRYITGKKMTAQLWGRHVLSKEADLYTMRFSPTFAINEEEIDYAANQVRDILYVAGKRR